MSDNDYLDQAVYDEYERERVRQEIAEAVTEAVCEARIDECERSIIAICPHCGADKPSPLVDHGVGPVHDLGDRWDHCNALPLLRRLVELNKGSNSI